MDDCDREIMVIKVLDQEFHFETDGTFGDNVELKQMFQDTIAEAVTNLFRVAEETITNPDAGIKLRLLAGLKHISSYFEEMQENARFKDHELYC